MSEISSQADKKFIQEVTGTFLYYARAVDTTMLTELGSIASKQENPTKCTTQKTKQLLEYAGTHPNESITYRASDIVLSGHRDASHFSESGPQIRAGAKIFMTDESKTPPTMVPS